MSGHIFISHGSETRDDASALSDFLEARGVRTWIAPRDVRPGMDYSEQLQEAIETCLAFVVLISDMANKSPYVRAETEMAFSTSKPIFPVRNADISPAAGLAFFLKIRHWTDAFGPGADAAMDRLATELRALSGLPADETQEPPAPPPPPQAPPPQAPPPPLSAPASQAAPADEARLRAAIGPNADFYLGRWRQMDEKGTAWSWNWAACLANFYWFGYRKMWPWMAAMGIGIVLVTLLGLANPRLGMAANFLLIGATFLTGIFGNHLYRRQVTRLLAAHRDAPPESLAVMGGVSRTALLVSLGATILLVVIGLALAAQQMRSQLPQPVPAPGPAPGPAPAPSPRGGGAQTSGIDPSLLIGRWTDNGDCSNAFEYTADGRILLPDGSMALWRLNGDQLTLTGSNGSRTIRIASIDRSAAYGVNPDGSVESSQRC
jgi:hypothetical protein